MRLKTGTFLRCLAWLVSLALQVICDSYSIVQYQCQASPHKYRPFWKRLPKSAALASSSFCFTWPTLPPSAISFSRSKPRLLGSSSSSFCAPPTRCSSTRLRFRLRSLYSRIRRAVSSASLSSLPTAPFREDADAVDAAVAASLRPNTSSSNRRLFSSGVSVQMALTPARSPGPCDWAPFPTRTSVLEPGRVDARRPVGAAGWRQHPICALRLGGLGCARRLPALLLFVIGCSFLQARCSCGAGGRGQ